LKLGPYRLKNRLVALPVFTGYAHPGGWVSSLLVNHYKMLAGSEVAMVIVANAAVSSDGIASRHNLRADDDEYIPGLNKIAEAIKGEGARACLQLNHTGRFAKTEQPLLPAPLDSENLAFNIASLKSFMNFFPFEKRFALTRYFLQKMGTWRHSMSSKDLERVKNAFGDSAERACQAGFDMVELHGANGYLLNQFLSSFTNKAPSSFGGDFQSRTVFPLSVVEEVKRRIPSDFPLGFRLNLREMVPGGIDLGEAVSFATLLEKRGIAYVSASVGSFNSIFSTEVLKGMAHPAYLRADMATLKQNVKVPTIISGRVMRPGIAEALLKDNVTDLIGLGRPVRVDTDWVKKARKGSKKIRICINCNACLKQVVLEQGFICSRWPRQEQERTDLEHKLLSRNFRGLMVLAHPNDVEIFRSALPLLFPKKENISTAISPTVLFLRSANKETMSRAQKDDFVAWSKHALVQLGFSEELIRPRERTVKESFDREVNEEVREGEHGIIMLCRNSTQSWRERVLYKERGKALTLIGTNERYSKVLVPVDLSPVTLLVLMFLRQTHFDKPDFQFHFVHALSGPQGPAEQRWEKIKKVTGMDADLKLMFIPTRGEVDRDLLAMMESGNYGTVVMGKRGLTGIKRWLLGSVSAGVLRGLKDQSLILID
ncbi:MAG: universal stress protein, partial [Deltaproteobacteria bacterium]|nr:universal stress protein [Deltaproteobacteria bacterium]